MLAPRVALVGLLVLTAACAADPSDVRSVPTEPIPTELIPAEPSAERVDAPVAPTSTATPAPPSTPPATAAPEPPAFGAPATLSDDTFGLSATLQQYREDEVLNQLSIKMENAGDAPVQIETLRLAWPGLTDTPPEEVDYPVHPRTRVDLKVPLGAAVCSSPPQFEEPLPDIAIAAIATTPLGEVTFPVTDPLDILERIYPRQCKRQAVEAAVGITLGDEWEDQALDPVEMVGTLTLERRDSTEPITVVDMHGSVVVNTTIEDAPVVLGVDDEVLAIPVVATQNRCDSHAIAEAKQPFVFTLDLRIGDVDVGYLVSPGADGKLTLLEGVIGRCPPDTDP